MLKPAQRTLILSPHTDDAELGCGATIARMLEDGTKVHVAVFSTAEDSLPAGLPPDTLEREFHKAMAVMGVDRQDLSVFRYPVRKLNSHRQEVLDALIELRSRVKPDVVFMPAPSDLHQDHQVLFGEGMRAFKTNTVLGYELPWNHVDFSAHAFSTVDERHIQHKWKALLEYKTQISLGRPYFSEAFIRSLATMRGVQIGAQFAEAFQVCRLRF